MWDEPRSAECTQCHRSCFWAPDCVGGCAIRTVEPSLHCLLVSTADTQHSTNRAWATTMPALSSSLVTARENGTEALIRASARRTMTFWHVPAVCVCECVRVCVASKQTIGSLQTKSHVQRSHKSSVKAMFQANQRTPGSQGLTPNRTILQRLSSIRSPLCACPPSPYHLYPP